MGPKACKKSNKSFFVLGTFSCLLVWTSIDVSLEFLRYLSVPDIIRYSQADKLARTYAMIALRLRFKDMIRPYVDGDVVQFSSILQGCGGVITGSSVTRMISAPSTFTPNNLNITVPARYGDRLLEYLEGLGYNKKQLTVDPTMSNTVRELVELAKNDLRIILTTSKSSIYPPLLCTLNTHEMKFLTPNEIVVLYPRLTYSSKAIVSYSSSFQLLPEGVTQVTHNDLFKKPCGVECPALPRRTQGLHGASVFKWSDEAVGAVEQSQDTHYRWRVLPACSNPLCIYAHAHKGTGLH